MSNSRTNDGGVAGLPMYDLAPVREWQDAWWAGVAGHLRAAGVPDAPDRLSRELSLDALWGHPRLVIAQTCGYPLTHAYAGRLKVVATPCHAAPGCAGGDYSSAIVVRENADVRALSDMRGGVCAINGPDSWSGRHALRVALARERASRAHIWRVVTTGSHAASIAAVAQGHADLCAVDAVTHALLVRHDPGALAGTRVIGFTPAAPGLPYVTRGDADGVVLDRLRRGLRGAMADPRLADAREALLISGMMERDAGDYGVLPAAIAEAERLGCPALV